MNTLVETLNILLAFGTILLQIATVIVFFFYIKKRNIPFLSKFGIHIVFLVSLASLFLTLLYSEVFGFVPCGLCWFQRVFLYPIVFISGLALFKKDRGIADYIITLSIPGALIALYQHYLQMGGTQLINCPAIREGADCAKRILFEFGYITYPLMSLSVFLFFILVMLFVRRFPFSKNEVV